MTTETENDKSKTQEQAEEEAAFAASFDGKDLPAATQPQTKTEPNKDATEAAAKDPKAATTDPAQATTDPKAAASTEPDQAATDPAAPSPTEAASTTTPISKADEVAELRAELRRVHGRFGALHDELKQLKTAKEAEGKPAVATQVELTRLKAEYPELADVLTEDLAKAIGGLAGKSADPKEIEKLVTESVARGVAQEAARLRDAAVDDAHPNWRADLFTQDAATGQKQPSADYLAWRKTLSEDEAKAFETSTNPYFVNRKLTAFYEWKNKAAEANKAKQQRLAAAVTPQGVPRAAPTTMSENEAMQKGFEEGFNS